MKTILKNENFQRFVTGLILGFCFFGSYFHSLLLFSLILIALLFIILFFEWPKLINLKITNFKYWLISFIYPILPISTLIYLNLTFRSKDFLLPLYPFFVSWTADTGAYILGKLIGKHKICPTISPGKSWQGLFGGFISVTIFNILYLPGIKTFPFTIYLQSFFPILLFSFLITIIAFLGDIFISFLKRKIGLKDTGNLLPGHGGLLDRFDSVLFVSTLLMLIILANKLINNFL
ncbi:MAG: phosphatidate cytidylyltransferase [bacterium]